MTTVADAAATDLLSRHLPRLVYDSGERYFAVEPAAWIADFAVVLERRDGPSLDASDPDLHLRLSLGFLGVKRYADGVQTSREDRLAARDPASAAGAWRRERPTGATPIHGRASVGGDGRVWLAYWFFYPYNDYPLIGRRLPVGRHEGDWEMVQVRLDADAAPELLLCAVHAHVEAWPWERVWRAGEQPILFVARGSHGCHTRPGRHWTGSWWDRADGAGAAPESALELLNDTTPSDGASDAARPGAWVHWPGRWGGTRPRSPRRRRLGLDAISPHGPGHQRQWSDPARLLAGPGGRRP